MQEFSRQGVVLHLHKYSHCMYMLLSADVCFQRFDDVVHLAGFLEIVFDFIDGVQNCRVVAGEDFSDFRQGIVGQIADEVHSDLSR